jgi:hypothetical protein
LARQQPGPAVIESPSGMIRIGAVAASAGRSSTPAATTISTATKIVQGLYLRNTG